MKLKFNLVSLNIPYLGFWLVLVRVTVWVSGKVPTSMIGDFSMYSKFIGRYAALIPY
jgi:hypothetical protein